VGPVSADHSMKLLHNYVSLGMVTLLAEAAACAQANHVAPEAFVEVLAKDTDARRDIADAVLATLETAHEQAPDALVPELARLLAQR
jgi:3-hydroxyisobutyrate dehydrogenase-like beta-hydroxyacid dehydrogenase